MKAIPLRSLALAGALALPACTAQPPGSDRVQGEERAAIAPAAASSLADPHAAHGGARAPTSGSAEGAPSPTPSGYAPFAIDPAKSGGLGLATAPADERDLTRKLRTVGMVVVDETRTSHVHPKVRGWIDGIRADFVGRKVKAGEALCSIYSQEVFAAELEFLAILDRAGGGAVTAGEFAQAEATAHAQLLDASRRRLSLWDVPRGEIRRLESSRTARRTFALSAPRAGVVVQKQAVDGLYVEPSMELYTLSDLSRVWVLADVYESDVPYVHLGSHAQLGIEGLPGMAHAAVTFIPPTLDEATRTLKIRFELDNAEGALRPGAFVSVAMDLPLGKGLTVPENAVIRTGTRAVVFVIHDGGHAQPREVRLGPLVGDRYRVDAGLAAGEQVAIGAQFLLDSESRLQGSSSPSSGHVH